MQDFTSYDINNVFNCTHRFKPSKGTGLPH
jgi:hypothetical protein